MALFDCGQRGNREGESKARRGKEGIMSQQIHYFTSNEIKTCFYCVLHYENALIHTSIPT